MREGKTFLPRRSTEDTEGKNYKTGLEGLMKSRFPLMLIKPLVDSVISVSSVANIYNLLLFLTYNRGYALPILLI